MDIYESFPNLRRGFNDFDNVQYNLNIHNRPQIGVSIRAEENWWGSNIQDEIRLKISDVSLVSYSPWCSLPNNHIQYEPENVVETAYHYYTQEQFNLAIPLFHQILADNEITADDFSSVKYLLTCYKATEGLSEYESFITSQLENENLNEDLAKAYKDALALISRNSSSKSSNYQDAIAYYESILENNPTFVDSVYAVIDLGNTILESQGKSASKFAHLNPKNYNEHLKNSSTLLQLLRKGHNAPNDPIVAKKTELFNNYPNPFNPDTKIDFYVANQEKVELSIFNIKGQKVTTLMNSVVPEGKHQVIWNGKDQQGKNVGSGVYFYRLNVEGKKNIVKKCILMK